MKLLFIGNVGYRFNSFIYSSSVAAKKLGIEFHVAGSWTGYDNLADRIADEEKYGVKIHQVDFIRTPYDPRNIKAYRQVVDLIRKEKIDIIHCNTPIGGVVGRLAGKKCGVKPVIYQVHGFHFYNGAPLFNWLLYYPIEKLLAHFTDALITINSEDYERARNKFHLRNNGRVYYIPGVGIDTSMYQVDEIERNNNRCRMRNELDIPEDAVVLISVGDLNKNKNNEKIIKALLSNKNKDIHYVICGNGELRPYLEQLSEPIKKRVHFLGYRTDIIQLYQMSDIYVMPSYREGLSRSLMEAMASGLPCIVSKIRGNMDLINDQVALCNPCKFEEFSSAIDNLSNSLKLRNELGVKNKREIKKYDLENIVKRLINVYKNLT